MKKVYCQPYTKGRHISCYFGKTPKGVFKGDVIKIVHPFDKKEYKWYMTPDEAVAFIRALSAGVHHYLVKHDRLAKLKGKQNKTFLIT